MLDPASEGFQPSWNIRFPRKQTRWFECAYFNSYRIHY